jgi:hypothetical protein
VQGWRWRHYCWNHNSASSSWEAPDAGTASRTTIQSQ